VLGRAAASGWGSGSKTRRGGGRAEIPVDRLHRVLIGVEELLFKVPTSLAADGRGGGTSVRTREEATLWLLAWACCSRRGFDGGEVLLHVAVPFAAEA